MKGNQTSAPHDAIFKKLLSHPETARDFLRLYLPPVLLRTCDLATLTLESGSFIEDPLRRCYSDVLYSLKTTRGDGYIYALIEHQSSPDRHMAFRLMRYAIAAMQRHLDAGHDRLPLVVPLLFYHGRVTPYPYSMSWLQMFSEPELAGQLYGSDFTLIDLTAMSDDEIMGHRRMAILELLQKHIRQRDLSNQLEPLATLLRAGYTAREQLVPLLNYMLQAGEVPQPDAFIRELVRRASDHKEEMMTIAEWLEQKGMKRGLKQGVERGLKQGVERGLKQGVERGLAIGRQEGEIEGKRAVARNMLDLGFNAETVSEVTGLSTDDLAEIRR